MTSWVGGIPAFFPALERIPSESNTSHPSTLTVGSLRKVRGRTACSGDKCPLRVHGALVHSKCSDLKTIRAALSAFTLAGGGKCCRPTFQGHLCSRGCVSLLGPECLKYEKENRSGQAGRKPSASACAQRAGVQVLGDTGVSGADGHRLCWAGAPGCGFPGHGGRRGRGGGDRVRSW